MQEAHVQSCRRRTLMTQVVTLQAGLFGSGGTRRRRLIACSASKSGCRRKPRSWTALNERCARVEACAAQLEGKFVSWESTYEDSLMGMGMIVAELRSHIAADIHIVGLQSWSTGGRHSTLKHRPQLLRLYRLQAAYHHQNRSAAPGVCREICHAPRRGHL